MNFKIYLLLLLALMVGATTSFAQRCVSDDVNRELALRDPAFAHKLQERAAKWAAAATTANNGLAVNTSNGIVYEIPVVVHVMHTGVPVGNINNPTDATIVTYIEYLNSTYAANWSLYDDTLNGGVRIPIKFVLAKRTPGCNPSATTGIVRMNVSTAYPNYTANGINRSNTAGVPDSVLKSLSNWPSNEYYNIWMVNYIDGPSGGTGGYAYFPGAPSWVDGTVILAQYATPSGGAYYYAVPHELGHAFGLAHTFGNGSGTTCPSNSNCAVDGDGICDTEPHINLNNGVCASGINPCTGVAYQGVQYNFMNYTACPRRFTANQRTSVLFNLMNYRPGLISSLGTSPPTPFTAPAAACIPTIVNGGNNFDMGPHEIELADLTVGGSGYTNDGYKVYIDKTCTQSGAHLTAGSAYTLYVNTYNNQQNVRAWIDYNNDGTFATTELVMSHTGTTNDETHAGTFTVPLTGVNTCVPLRIRVMADWYLASALQPCNALQYGQAEDYTVYVSPAAGTPTVAIAASPAGAICGNATVNFSATTTNTTSPAYQWKKNGTNVGTATTYTNASWVNGDVITLDVTSTANCTGTTTTTSNAITMAVSPAVTPTVSIAANTGSTICAGTAVTFTATPTNAGTAPIYQWKKNGVNVGLNQTSYTDNGLINGDVITAVLTSNALCATTPNATSNAVTMVVNANVTPGVTVTSNTGTTICSGTSVTFTASPVNGGTVPAYQWKRNGVNVGAGANTYTNNALVNNDVISVVLTSNAACAAPATATNAVTMNVGSSVTPSVSITTNPGTTICTGTNVTFTAVALNGGTSPTYQWKKNNIVVGTGATYASATLTNGDIITVVLTSNATCANPTTATSPAVTMTVGTTVSPTAAIAANPGTAICTGTLVTFTATTTNGGTVPAYQWKKNGVNVGGNTSTYIDGGLANNDVVFVQLTSNSTCAVPAAVSSNSLTMGVTPAIIPTIAIAANPGSTVCSGNLVTYTATATNAGSAPVYQWKKNGVNVGTNSTVYGPIAVANADVITATLVSNAPCASSAPVTSTALTMIVNPTVIPLVSVTTSPSTNICAGTLVTFSATIANGGTNPVYQWKKNGVNVGSNSATYTDGALNNGNTITCVLTSNAPCASTATATSSAVTMTVNPTVIPSVNITSNASAVLCAGTPVTFSATTVNAGSAPSYQWRVNGVNVGNGNSYGPVVVSNGNAVNVVVVSNALCAAPSSATSNTLNMSVNPVVLPSLTIASSATGPICAGTPVTFSATPVNGGTSPAYQWFLNGINAGVNTPSYSGSSFANGDVVTAQVISNAICASTAPVASNSLSVSVTPLVVPSASILATPGDTICAGNAISFTATPLNAGTAPVYVWKRNGLTIGSNSTSYIQPLSNNGDIVTFQMVSNANCATVNNVLANIITVHVNALPNPVITKTGHVLSAGAGFASYEWFLNGTALAGRNSDTLTATQNGNYSVTVIDNKGCTNTSSGFNYSTVSISTIAGTDEVTFYPNPARDMVYFQSAAGTVHVQVFTMEGKLVLDQKNANKASIGHLADGIYTLQIRNAKGILLKTAKLTKATY